MIDADSGWEAKLIEALETGKPINLRPVSSDWDEMRSWGTDRSIDADLIRKAMLGRLTANPDPHGLRLHGARIVGLLDLENVQSDIELDLSACYIEGGINLRDATLGTVALGRCLIGTTDQTCLSADRLKANAVWIHNARVEATDDTAPIDISDAHISGGLDCSGAQLTGHDTDGNSLFADGLTVDGSMFLRADGERAFTAAGAVRLVSARITGQLDCTGAQLTGHETDSLVADGLIVDGDMYLPTGGGQAFTAAGAVSLPGAHITGQFEVKPIALGTSLVGVVVLTLADASVGDLVLDPDLRSRPDAKVDLDGATYRGLPTYGDLRSWLCLLRQHTDRYSPQAYQQLAAVNRAAGHEADARRILIAQQDDRRDRVLQPADGATARTRTRLWLRRTGLTLQKAAIGYGYRTWPAFLAVLILAMTGGLLGVAAGLTYADGTGHHAAYRAPKATRPGDCSTFEQLALGVRVPFLSSLGAGDCTLDTTTTPGALYGAAIWTVHVLTWAAGAVAVAGYTGLVRKT